MLVRFHPDSILWILSVQFITIVWFPQDLKNQVEKIAKFLQIELTEEELKAVTKANTFQKKKEKADIVGEMKLRKGKKFDYSRQTIQF